MDIRTLRADEIDVRIGGFNKGKTGGFLLLYKDARVDMAILDETFGIYGWQRKHEVINGKLFCTISIYDKETKQWIDKQDVGVESNNDATKGEASDSFKRAGFNIGMGRELYTAPFIWINGLDKDDKFTVKEISYNDKREISQITIVDNKGEIAFKTGTYIKPTNTTKKESKPVTQGNSSLADEKELAIIYKLVKDKNYGAETMATYIKKAFNKNSSKELTKYEASKLIEMLNAIGE